MYIYIYYIYIFVYLYLCSSDPVSSSLTARPSQAAPQTEGAAAPTAKITRQRSCRTPSCSKRIRPVHVCGKHSHFYVYGCFYKLVVLFGSVSTIRAPVFGVYNRSP